MKRLLVGIILLAITLWVNPIAGFVLAIVFALSQSYRYYEIIAFAVCIDIVYQTTIEIGVISLPVYTILGVLFFSLASLIQKRINFHV